MELTKRRVSDRIIIDVGYCGFFCCESDSFTLEDEEIKSPGDELNWRGEEREKTEDRESVCSEGADRCVAVTTEVCRVLVTIVSLCRMGLGTKRDEACVSFLLQVRAALLNAISRLLPVV